MKEKRFGQRFIAAIVALVMILVLIPVGVIAEENESSYLIPTAKGSWENHYYEVFDAGLTWNEAYKKCEEMGGHLATITSEEEQKYIEALLFLGTKNCYWMGGEKVDNAWTWITGETWGEYTNWAKGEPNNSTKSGYEDKLMIYNGVNTETSNGSGVGLWNDLNHNGTNGNQKFYGLENFGYICEWEDDNNIPDTPISDKTVQPFNLDVFKANLYFKEGTNPVTNGVAGYYDSINHLHQNNLTTPWLAEIESDLLTKNIIESWDDLNVVLSLDPSKKIESGMKVEEYATAILLQIMECNYTSEKYEASRNEIYKNSKKAINNVAKTLKLTGKAKTWEDFDWGNVAKYKIVELSPKQREDLEAKIKENTEFSSAITDTIKIVDYVTDGVETVGDLFYKIAEYSSVCESASETFSVLREMNRYVQYPLLKSAINKVLKCENDFTQAVITGAMDTAVTASVKTYQAFYGKVLETAAASLGATAVAVVSAIKIGGASGKLLCDTCFCTSKITEQYYKMKMIDNAEVALYKAIDSLGSSYISDMTVSKAKVYNEAVDMYYNLYDLSGDYAKQFSKYVLADGVLGNKGKAKDKYPEFEELISQTQETAQKIYKYSNGKWLSLLLAVNYPDLFGTVDPVNLYRETLLDVIDKLNSGDWDYSEILTDDLSLSTEDVSFCFVDLDGNGISEMLLVPSTYGVDDNQIYDVFTIENGEVKHLLSGWSRNRFYLTDDGYLINYGSGGAYTGLVQRFSVEGSTLYSLDGVCWDDGSYYSCRQGIVSTAKYLWEPDQEISENEANDYLKQYSKSAINIKSLNDIHSLDSKIVLETDAVQLLCGDFRLISAVSLLEDYSDYDLVWSSENEDVVSATAPGILIANGEGKTKVTVSTENNKNVATLEVEVKPVQSSNPATPPSEETNSPSQGSTTKPASENTTKPAEDNTTKPSEESTTKPAGETETKANGIIQLDNGKWAMVKDGEVDETYTGIAKNEYGWWRVVNGYVDFDANGIYKNEYGWWKTTNGKVTFKENGVFKNDYGWWRVKDSKVDFKAQSIYQNQYGWWKTTNGKVTFKENGVFKNEYGWWKVKNSKVDFSFTGIASNKYGMWYVKNGKVDFSKNGKVKYNGTTYSIKNGKVQ